MNRQDYRARLIEQRDRLRHLLEESRQALRDRPDAGIDDASAQSSDTEIGDAATGTYQQELEASFALHHRDRLQQVDEALWRLDHGLFGNCLRCGAPIPEGRLAALPENPFCIDCAGLIEAAA